MLGSPGPAKVAYAAQVVAKQPARVLFGNDSGWRGNIAGRCHLAECRIRLV